MSLIYPRFRVGQELYLQRDQKIFEKGQRVKVRRLAPMIGGFRYEVEREHQREWCMENDLDIALPR